MGETIVASRSSFAQMRFADRFKWYDGSFEDVFEFDASCLFLWTSVSRCTIVVAFQHVITEWAGLMPCETSQT